MPSHTPWLDDLWASVGHMPNIMAGWSMLVLVFATELDSWMLNPATGGNILHTIRAYTCIPANEQKKWVCINMHINIHLFIFALKNRLVDKTGRGWPAAGAAVGDGLREHTAHEIVQTLRIVSLYIFRVSRFRHRDWPTSSGWCSSK